MSKGYTVDFRLREFRKLVYGKQPEFIPFSSPQGEKLITRMLKAWGIQRIIALGYIA